MRLAAKRFPLPDGPDLRQRGSKSLLARPGAKGRRNERRRSVPRHHQKLFEIFQHMSFQTKRAVVSTDDGRNFILLAPLVYVTEAGETIRVPAGSASDGA